MGVLQLHRPDLDIWEARSAGRAQGTPQSQGVSVTQHHLCSTCTPWPLMTMTLHDQESADWSANMMGACLELSGRSPDCLHGFLACMHASCWHTLDTVVSCPTQGLGWQ